jgi:hypothetical protein
MTFYTRQHGGFLCTTILAIFLKFSVKLPIRVPNAALISPAWCDEDRHYLSMPGLGERFTCLLNRVVGIAGLLKRGKEPLTAVAALVRDKQKKFLKRLGFLM